MRHTPPVDGTVQTNQCHRAPIAERTILLQGQPSTLISLRCTLLSFYRFTFHQYAFEITSSDSDRAIWRLVRLM